MAQNAHFYFPDEEGEMGKIGRAITFSSMYFLELEYVSLFNSSSFPKSSEVRKHYNYISWLPTYLSLLL